VSLGYEVNQDILNAKCADAVIKLRSAFDGIENIAKWLANNPSDGTNDPLVNEFGYTADEAYVIRIFFETFDSVRTANTSTFDIGRKMTGLE
jgi:hypothetical protein